MIFMLFVSGLCYNNNDSIPARVVPEMVGLRREKIASVAVILVLSSR